MVKIRECFKLLKGIILSMESIHLSRFLLASNSRVLCILIFSSLTLHSHHRTSIHFHGRINTLLLNKYSNVGRWLSPSSKRAWWFESLFLYSNELLPLPPDCWSRGREKLLLTSPIFSNPTSILLVRTMFPLLSYFQLIWSCNSVQLFFNWIQNLTRHIIISQGISHYF